MINVFDNDGITSQTQQ